MSAGLLKENALQNTLLLDALQGRNHSRPPVWLMRQAGRYMPSYQKIKEKHSLLDMFQHEELITKITLLPVDELDIDAAILFSDILLPLQALGFDLFYGTQGPKLSPSEFSIDTLKCPSKEEMQSKFSFVSNSVRLLKKELKIPLLGFSGAPFTLASYLLDSDKHHILRNTKVMMYKDPAAFSKLLELMADIAILYLRIQVDAGVDAVQIFDSWAGVLDPFSYEQYCVKYLKKILKALPDVPVIVFSRGSCHYVKELISLSPTAISFDWQSSLTDLKKLVPEHIAIQGNLDPDFLQAEKNCIKQKVFSTLKEMENDKRYIFNLGHGLLPNTPYDNVKYLVDLVKSA
ncbi:MAG: Uroporphyrinogen decarboxylase [Chlamydiia bacterium]|nr:Uroporphyrinogen decarboxylase [Chlamydiia bacterium]